MSRQYFNEEYSDMVRAYATSNESIRGAINLYREKFPNRRIPSYYLMLDVNQRLRLFGRLTESPSRKGQRKRRPFKQQQSIIEYLKDNPDQSPQCVAKRFGVSQQSIMKLCSKQHLNLIHLKNVQDLGVKLEPLDQNSGTENIINLKMCRICYKDKGQYPIFNNKEHPNIPEDIFNFSGVQITESEELPNNICTQCLHLLLGCDYFRDICNRTNELLTELSKKNEINGIKNVNSTTVADESLIECPSELTDNDEIINEYTWSCDICKETFYDKGTYNGHFQRCKRRHKIKSTKNQFYLCDTCGKTTTTKASLLIHKRTHENVFPHMCDQCPYKGRTIDLLKVHKRTHLTEKPYKCSMCPKTSVTASNLSKHFRQVHSTNRPYQCIYCEKGFTYKHLLNRHIRDTHLRQNTSNCDICLKQFNTRKIMLGHRVSVHKMKSKQYGRLPSYLQCQLSESNDLNNVDSLRTEAQTDKNVE
ncbi:zinc finger protein 888-like [Leptidea sinapis]|uniref:zinc finger protein 888-like n=1 Tax=Leptidea sinapis TaxID=189913 RepID=UPI002135DE6C|nr:zinc finger protein 888-like [Leptidea sinapis]